MKTEKKGNPVIRVIVVLLVLLVLTPVVCTLLAVLPPSMKMNDVSGGQKPESLIQSAGFSSAGITVTENMLEKALGTAPVTSGISGLTISRAGIAISEKSVKAGIQGTFIPPAEVPILGRRNIPVSLTVTFGVTSGDRPQATLKGLSVGLLPIPVSLIARFCSEYDVRKNLPEGISLEGTTIMLEPSKLDAGPIRLKSITFSDGALTVSPNIPETAGTDALRAIGQKITANAESLRAEAASNGPSAKLAETILALAPLATRPESAVAVAEFATGTATVKYQGSETLEVLPGDRLLAGGVVSTGIDSSIELRLTDQSILSITENSTIALDSIAVGGKGTTDITAVTGSVLAKVAKISGREGYRIRTPGMVCGVRGTKFLVAVMRTGKSVLAVVEGAVEASTSSGTESVPGGKEISSSGEGKLSAIENISGESSKEIDGAAFRLPENRIEKPLVEDSLARFWTLARPLVDGWNALPEAEQKRLENRYGAFFKIDEIARSFGISPAQLEQYTAGN